MSWAISAKEQTDLLLCYERAGLSKQHEVDDMSPYMVKLPTAYFSCWKETQLTRLHPQNRFWVLSNQTLQIYNWEPFNNHAPTSVRSSKQSEPSLSVKQMCANSHSHHKPPKQSSVISTVFFRLSSAWFIAKGDKQHVTKWQAIKAVFCKSVLTSFTFTLNIKYLLNCCNHVSTVVSCTVSLVASLSH